MFNYLYQTVSRRQQLIDKVSSLCEGKTWEQIALELYQILDDIDTADDACKENSEAFQNVVLKLQAKKNSLLCSYDGYTVEPVVEIDEAKRIKLSKFDPEKHKPIEWYFSSSGKVIDAPVPQSSLKPKQTHAQSVSFEELVELAKVNPQEQVHFNYSTGRSGWVTLENVYVDVELKENGQYKGNSKFDIIRNELARVTYGKNFSDLSQEQQRNILKNMKKKGLRTDIDLGKFDEGVEEVTDISGLSEPEQELKLWYKGSLNKPLEPTTYSADKGWIKFWLLTDGTVIPVSYTHMDAAKKAGTSYTDVVKAGVIVGRIISEELDLDIEGEPSSTQISSLRKIAKDYGIEELRVEQGSFPHSINFFTKIKSPSHLVVLLSDIEKARKQALVTAERVLNENLTAFAKNELQLAGLFDEDSDYNGMLGEAVLELIEKFGEQGHSGMSAAMTVAIFDKLASWKPLSELTDDPDEWQTVREYYPGPEEDIKEMEYQSRRSPSCFSGDGGKTYWDIDEDYYKHTDENGITWSGGLSEEEWKNRPIHTSKHIVQN